MSWRSCLLGEAVTLKRGYDLPSQLRHPGSVPIVSSAGISGFHSESKVKGPGVITGRYGTLGEVHYVEQNFWPLNTTLYVQDFKGNLPRYIAYLLTTLDFASKSGAAAVPGVNRNDLHRLPVRIPALDEQIRIASILSAYDDLIENNTRRITILEEMARRIYEEWFVHFRFPGHEDVRMVESALGPVPEGWELTKLENAVELNYGKALKSEDRVPGPYPVYGSSGVVGSHSEFMVDAPGIIVGRKGNVGSVHWCDVPFFPIDTVYYVRTALPLHYVYFNLLRQNFINNDAAVPGLNRNQAYALPFLVPDPTVLKPFVDVVSPIFTMLRVLRDKNANLRTQRDLLLPKLISGEIDVSALPEPEVLAA